MNLSELNTHSMKVKRFHKIFESRFGHKINFDNLQVKTAVQMVNKLDETISKMRRTKGFQVAERNAQYSETLMLKEGLDDWLHLKLNIAHKRKLTEGEIEQAEAVLAAKDFVDRLQKMLEDVSRIINEDLPPLSDVVRDQMGVEQADAYMQVANGALMAIQTAISTGRSEMDAAARSLAGEESPATGMDMAGDEGTDDTNDIAPDADMDIDNGDDFAMADPEVGGDLDLGRETR